MPQKKNVSPDADSGRKQNQKLKTYLVLRYLTENTDENHLIKGEVLATEIEGTYNIPAERRSIYRDIEEINKVMLMLEEGISLEEAEAMLAEDEDDEYKYIVYDKHRKGYYAKPQQYTLSDLRLLAECVYSAKFLTAGEAEQLVNIISTLTSKHQTRYIRHNAFLTDRQKTDNKGVLNNISLINDAMSDTLDGEKHIPEKITFKYLKHTINDLNKHVERRHGETYKVSPYQLLINDGYYYLLAYNDTRKKMITYRVDRMKGVSFTGEPREGIEAFEKIDMNAYKQKVFSMFGGKETHVTIRFIAPLLDTMIDRFGKDRSTAIYSKVDENHCTITTTVEISDQFFGWLLGFGRKVKLLSPDDVVEEFKAYTDKIREMYD